MNTLAESSSLLVLAEYERVYLEEKDTGRRQQIAEHFGDPRCAVTGPDQLWVVVGGEGVTVFHRHLGSSEYFRSGTPPPDRDPDSWFVHSLRRSGPTAVRVLMDPWSEYASVWTLDVLTGELNQEREGPSLAGQPFREEVDF